jgi:hypothetical protein
MEKIRLINDKAETRWGISKCTSLATKNWSTCISENFSKELIYYLFDNKKILSNKKSKICVENTPDCKPDIEIDNYIFEINSILTYSSNILKILSKYFDLYKKSPNSLNIIKFTV